MHDLISHSYAGASSKYLDRYVKELIMLDTLNVNDKNDLCSSLGIMLDNIRETGSYDYEFATATLGMKEVHTAWLAIVDDFDLARGDDAKRNLPFISVRSWKTSVSSVILRYIELFVENSKRTYDVAARLHCALIKVVNKLIGNDPRNDGTDLSIQILDAVMTIWVNMPLYSMKHHTRLEKVYEAYGDLVADRKKHAETATKDSVEIASA